jgi:hypothetical protein
MMLRRLAVDLFLMTAIGVVLGLIGPFGSSAMPPAQRLLFWIGFVIAGYALFRPVTAVAGWVTEETRTPGWAAVVMTALVASVPLAGLVGFALGGMAVTDFWFGSRFPILYGQVALVGVSIHLLMLFLFRRPAAAPEPVRAASAESPAPAESPFLERLPPALGRDLLCLEMQDHYVRAETALGSTLLLMRFRDAVAELGASGMQVHRSWWVAAAAVEALERDGRGARLRLRGGGIVPISRALLPSVRERLAAPARDGFDSDTPPAKSAAGGIAGGARGIVS